MITQLKLKNFTVFKDLTIDFSPRINVIIGENGTGKTHLLKAAYGLCSGGTIFKNNPNINKSDLIEQLSTKMGRIFMPIDSRLGKMRRHGVAEDALIGAKFDSDSQITTTFHTNSKLLKIQNDTGFEKYKAEPVFIPTKEVLSLVQGMNHKSHDQKIVELIFDDTYIDISKQLIRPGDGDPESKIELDPRFGSIVPSLVNLIGGRYHWEDGGFCFQRGSYEERPDPERSRLDQAKIYQDSMVARFRPSKDPKYSSTMTAEGFRKVGLLHRLLVNGSIDPGESGPLFWDEPESNLNPKLMKLLVEILLELARNGQQIILATHDYVLLKWLDLLVEKEKDDHVRFLSLYKDSESSEINVDITDDYSQINKSAISDTFAELYDEDVKRALG